MTPSGVKITGLAPDIFPTQPEATSGVYPVFVHRNAPGKFGAVSAKIPSSEGNVSS